MHLAVISAPSVAAAACGRRSAIYVRLTSLWPATINIGCPPTLYHRNPAELSAIKQLLAPRMKSVLRVLQASQHVVVSYTPFTYKALILYHWLCLFSRSISIVCCKLYLAK